MSIDAYPVALATHAKIAVIDDDPDIASAIGVMLSAVSASVDVFTSARDYLDKAKSMANAYDLLVCDWSMPELDGLALVRIMRSTVSDCYKTMSKMPVIMLTSRFSEAEIAEALWAGADDFLIKPISVQMLRARVIAMLRRRHWTSLSKHNNSIHELHGYRFSSLDNTVTFSIESGQESVTLSHKEYSLALLLFQNPGKIFSRQMLADKIWRINPLAADTRTINSHVHMVRRKLRLSSGSNATSLTSRISIAQVYAVGYVLTLADEPYTLDTLNSISVDINIKSATTNAATIL